MFYIDWDMYNNEPNDGKPALTGINDDELIYKKVIKAIALYVKNYKEKAVKLLNKYGVHKTSGDEEIVTGITLQLYSGTKDFRDDLVIDLMSRNLLEDQGNDSSFVLTSAIIAAIIGASGSLIGGGTAVWAAKIKRKQEEERTRQENLRALAEAKSGELQRGSKQQKLTTIVVAVIIIILIVALFMFLFKKQSKKQ